MTVKHAPVPYRVEKPSKGSDYPILIAADLSEIATIFSDNGPEGRLPQAEFIVRACNTHDEARDMLAWVADWLENDGLNSALVVSKIHTTLAKMGDA